MEQSGDEAGVGAAAMAREFRSARQKRLNRFIGVTGQEQPSVETQFAGRRRSAEQVLKIRTNQELVILRAGVESEGELLAGFAAQGGQARSDVDCTGRALQEILVGLVDEIGILRNGVGTQGGACAQQSAYRSNQKGRTFSHV